MEFTPDYTAAERRFVNLCNRNGLSREGSNFVRAAVDPMADSFISPPSVPDGAGGVSVRRCIKQSFTISKPTLFPDLPWDAHVQLYPFLTKFQASKYNRTAGAALLGNNLIDYDAGLQPVLGGVCAYATPLNDNFSYATAKFLGQAALDPEYEYGSSRVVSVGIECINTSAPLYKSGSVTVFDLDQAAMDRTTLFNVVSTTHPMACQGVAGVWVRRPPLNFADAMLLPGSRQWEAEKGCYLVASRATQDYEPRMVDYVEPFMPLDELEDYPSDGTDAPGNHDELLGPTVQFTVAPPYTGGQFSVPGVKLHPLNMKGCIFTGLDPKSSVQIFVNYYIETFPSPAQKSLLVMAAPCAPKDPRALRLVNLLMSKMVVGVPSSWNGAGDWFRTIVEKIAQYAPIISTAFGQPEVGLLLGATAQAVDSFLGPQSPNSKPMLEDKQNASNKNKKSVNRKNTKRKPNAQSKGKQRA